MNISREEAKNSALTIAMDIRDNHFDFPPESILLLIDEIFDSIEDYKEVNISEEKKDES